MTRSIREVIAELDAFQPANFEEDILEEGFDHLYDVCAELADTLHPEYGAEALFALLERIEGKDLGSPGPAVQALEKLADYQAGLIGSMQRKPTTYTVWMVNRVLNTPLTPELRQYWLGLLQATLSHVSASEETKAEAERFIEYQNSQVV